MQPLECRTKNYFLTELYPSYKADPQSPQYPHLISIGLPQALQNRRGYNRLPHSPQKPFVSGFLAEHSGQTMRVIFCAWALSANKNGLGENSRNPAPSPKPKSRQKPEPPPPANFCCSLVPISGFGLISAPCLLSPTTLNIPQPHYPHVVVRRRIICPSSSHYRLQGQKYRSS